MDLFTHGLALLANGWAAYSGLATLMGLGGGLAVAAAVVFGAYLPGFIRTPLIVAGAIGLGVAGGLQAGQMRGAAEQLSLDHARALDAERTRTELAERTRDRIASQAATDHAAVLADNARLRKLNDVLLRDPRGGDVVLDRDVARRLREF